MKKVPLCIIFTGYYKEGSSCTLPKGVQNNKKRENNNFKEQNNSLETWKEQQEIRERLSKETLSPCNHKCGCYKCVFSCQLCFLQKGLGISYRSYSKKIGASTAKATTR
ncbi:tat protein [Simian immunodeficiency virus]|uniref:Protein Tat n=1 Tax=Simian immunodeficiency virus TaxID=11723 RepID=B7FCA5_SIV|nr:tat protein [Simian immunodeficiency virus]